VVAATLAATILYAPPASAKPYLAPKTQKEPVVAGRTVPPVKVDQGRTGEPFDATAPIWPGASDVRVALPSLRTRTAGAGVPAEVPGLPVSVDPAGAEPDAPTEVRVRSFDRPATTAAGVEGLLLAVSRSDGLSRRGSARISVNYQAFRWAYGGDWSSRLRLKVLPECALTSPDAPACAARDVAATNDVRAGTIAAFVDLQATGATLLAVTAGTSGPAGDYKATSLSPAATWTAGGSAGDFSWTYPLRLPPSLGGPAPTIDLAYSSSSVDGRMAAANNQPSWLGEGFEWSPGSIERRYNTCSEDMGSGANNSTKTGDQCWDTDNATLALTGHAGELIKDGSTANRWHLRNDDGTYVERRTGAGNGDNDGEWWVATTPDGTQHWFGGKPSSNSTLTAPVFGNHSGEPCYGSSFASSSCTQGWRWQLDHVVDRHGNTMTLTYGKETNKYAKNNTGTDPTQYDRAGYLTTIDYGTRTGSTGSAPMQVLFTVADRCLSGCATKDAGHWPDVPWDQECTASPCKSTAPTFWTTKRLSNIKTRVWNAATSKYKDVEQWTLTHSFPDPTDNLTAGLWLDKISHNGLVGGTTSVPDIAFVGTVLTNRVDTINDQYPAMNRFRMKTINSETGGKLDLTYSAPDCVKGSRMPDQLALQNNVLRCYPVKWTPGGYTDPINDFFHKYVVTDVAEADLSGSSSRVLTHYEYVGDPAWHYTDDDGLIKKEYKTWSGWRGYGAVRTTKGDPGEQSRIETRYFRGMHGDKLPSGTRTVTLPAIATGGIPAANDEDAYAGMTRESITYNGPGGAEVSATVSEPWQSAPTASRTINGFTVHARFTNTAAEHTRTALDGGRAPRTTTKRNTFDGYGMPIKVENRGDNAVADDQKCTLTDYVRNTSASVWIIDKVSRAREFAVDCTRAGQGGLTDDDVIEDEKTSYDQLVWNVAPTKGAVSKAETIKTWNGGSPTYLTASRATHDAYGRVLESWDIRDNKTTTAYIPATGGPVTGITETSPLGWVKSTVLEPAWKLPLTTTDPNGRKVDYGYDGLGRLTKVWFPGRDRATQTPNMVFEYLVRTNGPLVVTTKRLNPAGDYVTSYQFYDNLSRLRQTQDADGAGGTGAAVTDTYYDSVGRAFKTHDSYLAPVAPSTNLFLPTAVIPSQKLTLFDGAGREIALIQQKDAAPASPGGTEKWRTTTGYGGDRIDVTPPQGGVTTSTITDVDGNAVESRSYHAGAAAGSDTGFDRTRYTYNRKGKLVRVTDPAQVNWDYSFDLLGRQTGSVDPDKGTTTTTFNDYGDIVTSTDGRGVTIAYTYDAIGRKTTLRDASPTGPKRAEWVYDTLTDGTVVEGQLVKTIRYVGAEQYVKESVGYTVDYKPTSVKYAIPGTETGLTGSYSYVYTYHQDGSDATTRLPAAGDLPIETIARGYDSRAKATTLDTTIGATSYVTGTDYTSFGELGALHLRNNAGNQADIVRTYETDTRRLAQIWTTKQAGTTTVADVRFGYDPMGNVTRIADLTAGDTQCFSTDYLRQMTEAWTPATGSCNPAPSPAVALGGPSSYWHSYRYDTVGNRTELVEHGTPTGDRTTTYTTPVGQHRLTGTSTADGTGTRTAAYGYDDSGNMSIRPTTGSGTQTMTWDVEGHLATSQDPTGTTSYVYDVDGTRLIRKDPTGKTLYLPGQELRYTASSGVKTCTRYYTHAGQTVATRTGSGLTWLSGDHHGTAQISINALTQAVATRRETPFGQQRGSTGSWPASMDKGFVGGTKDNTGLTHLGAREYDPLIGRFISVDPVIDVKDPQQMHGYAYATNAPITASDPDGLWPKWMKNAASNVANVASSVKENVVKGVVDNAGLISAVTGVAAIACTFIPPLQAFAPAFAVVSAVTGAIDTANSCGKHDWVDCGLGVAGMIPGGRAVALGIKGGQKALKGAKALGEAESLIDANKLLKGTPGFKDMDRALRRELRDAKEQLADGSEAMSAYLNPWSKSKLADHRGWEWYERVMFGENVFWEGFKLGAYEPGNSYGTGSRHGRSTPKPKPKPAAAAPDPPLTSYDRMLIRKGLM
jgi:RHS repeat-associated protein